MSIVVSDTSPVRALANLGLLELLRVIYGDVIIPPAVAAELRNPPVGQAVVDLAGFSFVRVQETSGPLKPDFLEELDRGEAEALTLALELRADLILIDEMAGRAKARALGLEIIGVLGVLLEAKHRGEIETISPLLDQLQINHRFFIAPRLLEEILRLAGESFAG